MTEVLKGVRVVELSTMITAPLAGMMLADLGADVIKVEPPQAAIRSAASAAGTTARTSSPTTAASAASSSTCAPTRAARVLLKLLARADILLENYRRRRHGAAGRRRWTCSAPPIRRLIHCSITGFGAIGPYSARPAYDNVALALSGIASLLLDPEHPQVCGPTIADNATGMFACYGILGALYERERTGRGRRVEVNMLEAGDLVHPRPVREPHPEGIENDR